MKKWYEGQVNKWVKTVNIVKGLNSELRWGRGYKTKTLSRTCMSKESKLLKIIKFFLNRH